jgi:hypothetical protein
VRTKCSHAEEAILGALTEQLTQAQQIHHVIERVGTGVAKLSEHLPETIRTKKSELSSEERRLANFGGHLRRSPLRSWRWIGPHLSQIGTPHGTSI